MRRYQSPYVSTISFGPGPLSFAIKWLIGVNVGVFLLQAVIPGLIEWFGLLPASVIGELRLWQLATYMFLHANVLHLLFNMLAIWMFGTELERIWGTREFLKFYFVTGVGAALLTVVFSLLPFGFSQSLYHAIVIGASGAIYGLLLAFALYYPDRPILLALLFPIPAKYFVMIIGAIAFYSSLGATGGVASATHLGGLVIGYLYLRGLRLRLSPFAEVKYRYLKWRLGRLRRRFGVHPGGRADDWNRRVH
jgi:membrane associated rhomboid family serine protease